MNYLPVPETAGGGITLEHYVSCDLSGTSLQNVGHCLDQGVCPKLPA